MHAFHFIPAEPATTAVLFASPHSARDYPAEFLQASQLDELALRSSEDAYVDMFLRAALLPGRMCCWAVCPAPMSITTAPQASLTRR